MAAGVLPNYYVVLQVAPDASPAQVRRQYIRQMREARRHPDLGGHHEDAALVNEAYAVLADPQRRAAYDRVFLASHAAESQTSATATPAMRADRRGQSRWPYRGMLLLGPTEGSGIGGQCRDISPEGCALRTLKPLRVGELLQLVFQDDPGLALRGEVRWRRILPQRFGPPLYEGGVSFRGATGRRLADFLQRIALQAPR